jgi:hypothetical protein
MEFDIHLLNSSGLVILRRFNRLYSFIRFSKLGIGFLGTGNFVIVSKSVVYH